MKDIKGRIYKVKIDSDCISLYVRKWKWLIIPQRYKIEFYDDDVNIIYNVIMEKCGLSKIEDLIGYDVALSEGSIKLIDCQGLKIKKK